MAVELHAPPVLSTPDANILEDQVSVPLVERQQQLSNEELYITYEIERTMREIKAGRWRRIALQFPDDMLADAPRVFEELRKGMQVSSRPCRYNRDSDDIANDFSKIKVEKEDEDEEMKLFILGDTSYGACCVDEVAAEHVHADVVVHYGRSCLSPTARLPVIYVFTRKSIQLDPLIQAFKQVYVKNDAKVIVIADVTFMHCVSDIKSRLLAEGYENLFFPEIVHDPSSLIPNRTVPPETGPDGLSSWSIFHISQPPKSLLLTLSSRVSAIYIYPTHTSTPSISPKAMLASTTRVLRRRYALLTSLNTVSIFGILINTLSVRNYLHIVDHVKALIQAAGKKSYTFVVGKVNAAKIANFSEIGGWVVIGCWESSLIESDDFWKPIITPFELELVLKGDDQRIWTGEWTADFQLVLDREKQATKKKSVETKTEQEIAEEEEKQIDGGDLDSEPESAPPEFDLRTGRYVSNTRPMQQYSTVQSSSSSVNGGPSVSSGTLMKRINGDLATVGGTVSPAAEFLRSQRTWRGLGTDFYEGELGDPRGALIREGQRGIARGYVVDQGTEKT